MVLWSASITHCNEQFFVWKALIDSIHVICFNISLQKDKAIYSVYCTCKSWLHFLFLTLINNTYKSGQPRKDASMFDE